jgi:hypothetical protein
MKSTKIIPCFSLESVAIICLGLGVLNFFLAREAGRFYVVYLSWPLPLRAHGEFRRAAWLLYRKKRVGCRTSFFVHLGAIVKLRKATSQLRRVGTSNCPSVRPHGTTRFPMGGLSWNFIFEYFFKICWGTSSLLKIYQKWRVCFMNIDIRRFLIIIQ